MTQPSIVGQSKLEALVEKMILHPRMDFFPAEKTATFSI